MSEAAVLKEFLVSLGFKVNPGDERRFLDSIGAATVKAVALGTAVTGAAGAVVAGVARIADGLEQLYFASRRTNASVENLQATGFAAKQMGSDAAAALGSVENLARFLRNSPGGEGLLKNLGVATRDANGQMRDTVDLVDDLGKKFAEMPYYKAHAFAQALGIDERTLLALREGMSGFSQQYKDMLRAAGLDAQAAAKSSHTFMVELRLLGASFTILSQKIATSLTGRLGDNIRKLRETFVSNFDRIAGIASKVIEGVLRVADAVGQLAMRGAQAISHLVDWFGNLSPASQKIIEIIGGILIAWKALSVGFLATPIGRVVALATAILGLWDDYQTWKEGGKSLIDWSAWAPAIEATIDGLRALGNAIHDTLGFLGDWRPVFELILAYVAGSWALGMLGAMGKVVTAAGGVAASLTASLAGMLGSAGLVAAAGAAGYALGTLISKKFVEGTNFGDALGRTIAKTLAFFGNKDAADAVASEERTTPPAAVPSKPSTVTTAPARPAPNKNDPRGIRNNNPGNIEYGNFAANQGAIGREEQGRFAVFKDAQAGIDALVALLRSYMSRGVDTVRAIIAKYAPAAENNTEAYVANVAKRIGIGADQKLDPRNTQQLAGVVDAIIRVENGKNPYSREMIDRAAGGTAAASGAKPVEVNQTTHITVNGGADPKAVAQETSRAQNNVNEQLVRNMRGAILQ